MHCIVLSSPKGSGTWRIHRSVEILGYHHAERRVSILFALLAENLLEGLPNSLRFLHRGKLDCHVVSAWPLPKHPDEKPSAEGVLSNVYGHLFQMADGRVLGVTKLTAWDSEEPLTSEERVPILNWAETPGLLPAGEQRHRWPPDPPPPDASGHVPFTTWTLSPFNEKGFYLVSFELQFEGATYARLLHAHPVVFTVDGPERLLGRIEYEDMVEVGRAEVDSWLQRLGDFKDSSKRPPCLSYDVIILGPKYGDEVRRAEHYCANGIYLAPRQPSVGAERFLTADQFFTLPLEYKIQDPLREERAAQHDHAPA
jgi:hypothetical protein